jgi:glycosyltransferase involved in cell wall biosynthesis
MSRICCCIPAYNNAATIADVASRARAAAVHVIVVDDGSTDADLRELLKPLDVIVIRHENNLGKGAALLTAFAQAASRNAEYLITLDGDGQHFPEDIPLFHPHLDPATILIGSRQTVVGAMPSSSIFGREFSDFWVNIETGNAVTDTQSGFRVYPVAYVQKLNLTARHYNFEMEILAKSLWAGLNAKSVPIRVWYPEASRRVSSFRPFMDNLRISLVHTRLVFRQFLPWPHKRLAQSGAAPRGVRQWLKDLCLQNSRPLGLAAAATVSALLGIVLWPWGAVAVLYVAIRLHLNKIMCVAVLLICATPVLPGVCLSIGQKIVGLEARSGWAWFVGSHVVAFCAALAIWPLVYFAAQRLNPPRLPEQVNQT